MKIKIIELFGGIGACSKALSNLGIDVEIADYVEIDKYAVMSFNAMHGTMFEPQDIREWDKDIEADLIMHGSPCQDFSVAGKNAGGDKDSGTRSSLMYETLRIVEKVKPKYVIWENVKNLLSKKHRHNFDAYQQAMEQLGYRNHYQVLNAKDYGVPQNRERVFTVSIRNDIEDNFSFPLPRPLEIRLKDVLEENVDEKYYLTDAQINRFTATTFNSAKPETRIQDSENCSRTLLARDYKDPKCVRVGGLYDKDGKTHQAGSIYDPQGIAATLSTMQGGNQEPIVVASRGRYNDNGDVEQHLEPNTTGTTNTLTSVQKDNYVAEPSFVSKHYQNFHDKHGYTPEMFNPYNESEIKDVAPTQTTRCGSTASSATVLIDDTYKNREPREYEDCSPTLRAGRFGLKVRTANKRGYVEAHDGDGLNLAYPGSKTCRGRVAKESIMTLDTGDNKGVVSGVRIRKLTPLECWRLMGFDEDSFRCAEKVNSNSQLYKQAGNSIVVNVLESILKNLLLSDKES